MDERRRVDISKTMSYILRHNPDYFDLVLDPEGFVPIHDLLKAVRYQRPDVTLADIKEVVQLCDKGRFEMVEEEIRACYGHTFEGKISHPEAVPPDVLFHGTARRFVNMIKHSGLKPMGRQYVHLTVRRDFAEMVGRRKDRMPMVLEVNALQAYENYVPFYKANENFYLADFIPPSFIRFETE